MDSIGSCTISKMVKLPTIIVGTTTIIEGTIATIIVKACYMNSFIDRADSSLIEVDC